MATAPVEAGVNIPEGGDRSAGPPYAPKVGDRVRVRAGPGQILPCDELSHFPEEAGQTGTVMAARARALAPRHLYLVQFDRPPHVHVVDDELRLAVRHYAADELEPLSP